MKQPNYRYFDPEHPESRPEEPVARYFWGFERMFYMSAGRDEDYAREVLSSMWRRRVKGSVLDKLTSEPVGDRAMVLWIIAHLDQFSPGSTFPIEEYFAKSTRR